jgi:hypothetical protein
VVSLIKLFQIHLGVEQRASLESSHSCNVNQFVHAALMASTRKPRRRVFPWIAALGLLRCGRAPEQRLDVRREQSKPLVDALETYVNSAIASRRKARIDELLPWNWKANQADDCQSSLSRLGTDHPEITCGTERMLTDWIALFGFDFRQGQRDSLLL